MRVAPPGFAIPRPMKLSVIILNWNGRRHLEACLPALAAQTLAGFETIVVDNASQDDSVEYVRQQFPWVRLVVLTENRGFSGGNAAGLRAIAFNTELVALLNNDTAPEPAWLEHLEAAARAHPDCGAIASLIVTWDGATIDSAGDGILVTGSGFQRYHLRERSCAPPSGYVFGACGGAVLYRRSMLNEVGFLDERFFMNSEDTDLCFRARLAGWQVWYCAEAVVRHRVSASQGVWSERTVFLNQRNHLWLVTKCMPGRLLVKYSWAHVLEHCRHGIFFARRSRLMPWLQGGWAGVTGMGPFLKERKRLQASRRVKLGNLEKLFSMKPLFGFEDDSHGSDVLE